MADQKLLHQVMIAITAEKNCRLYAGTTTPTHVHELASFTEPECICDRAEFCRPGCPARRTVEKLMTRLKQKMGQALAKKYGTIGRPYFSRGWDLTPIRRLPHFRYHLKTYLPKHATEGGIFRIYK